MTDLVQGGSPDRLPAIVDPFSASGAPFEPEWHHITAALIDLPDDERRVYVSRMITAKDEDSRIPDALDALRGHARLRPSPQAVFRSILGRTDTAEAGYVRPKDIVFDLIKAGFSFERLRSNADQIINPGQKVIDRNLVSGRGIHHSYRLITPANARMLRSDLLEIPDEISGEVQALQLAYRAFRLVVPGINGSGAVHMSEVSNALSANFGYEIMGNTHGVIGKVGLVLGDASTPESIARIATGKLSKHPLFEVSSLRHGTDRQMRLKPGALPVPL